MHKLLIIYLHSNDPAQASWVAIDGNTITQSVNRSDLSQVSSIANDFDVYAIVPGQDVLLTSAQLPKLSHQRLLQALPFALEEQLIDDVTDLHFAIAEYQSDGTVPVAIVSQTKMMAWTNLYEQFGISPRAFIPEEFIVPYNENHWQINTYDNHCIVRTGKFNGFACEQDNLDMLIDLKLSEVIDKNSIEFVKTNFSEQQLLEKFSSRVMTMSFINLLQGAYQPKPQATKIKKVWKTAVYLAIAWISFAVIGNIISFFILHHQSSKIETAINQIYMRNFPQAKSVVAPRERMTEKLHGVSGQASKNNFLALLAELGNSLLKTPDVHIQTFDFREQQLMLEVMASSFDTLDNFTRALSQQGLSVKQQSAAQAGAQVKATLLIQGGKA